jgi:tRNA-specific 2-thiouridylase
VRASRNEVVVGREAELYRDDVTIGDVNWIAEPPARGEWVRIQLRHRAPAVAARVSDSTGATVSLTLEEPQRAVTPGQSGVVYRGDELVGGGRIR